MTIPKTLLLSRHPPGAKTAGGVFLKNLCKFFPSSKICCFYTSLITEKSNNSEFSWMQMEHGEPPTKHGLRRFGKKIQIYTRPIIEYFHEKVVIPRLVAKAVRFGKKQQVELLLASLDSITMVRMARPVAERLGIPLVVVVWDPPKYNQCVKFSLDAYSCGRMLSTFDETLYFATCCAVSSEKMKREYKTKYGIECVVMVFGEKPNTNVNVVNGDNSGRFLIGFAGSVIAEDVLHSFISALARRNWKIAGRDVVFRVHGAAKINLNTSIPLQIDIRGWRSHLETIQSLSECDLSYVPYPRSLNSLPNLKSLDENTLDDFVTLSFPSKIAAYMAAETPIFYHGVGRSSAVDFIKKYEVGVCCDTFDPLEIVDVLENYLADHMNYQRAKQACKVAFEQEFSASVFRKRLSKLIGVRESELISIRR